MVAIIEAGVDGPILAWKMVARGEYRAGLEWITVTVRALRVLGYGDRLAGRIVGNEIALNWLAAGRFHHENLWHEG